VVNRGSPKAVEARICGMDVRGVELETLIACDGYSMTRNLAEGDSVVTWERGIVRSGAGSYQLHLRHLLNPERWVGVELLVR